MTRPDLCIIRFGRHARRVVLIGSLSMLAVAACSSSDSAGSSSDATVAGAGATTPAAGDSSDAITVDSCAVVTDAVAAQVYGATATVSPSPSSDGRTCEVSIAGLGYTLAVHVDPPSGYDLQKSLAFENPTDVPGLGSEAVMGTSSDSTGAEAGLLYRTDGGSVYISGESDQAKLAALAAAIAAQG